MSQHILQGIALAIRNLTSTLDPDSSGFSTPVIFSTFKVPYAVKIDNLDQWRCDKFQRSKFLKKLHSLLSIQVQLRHQMPIKLQQGSI